MNKKDEKKTIEQTEIKEVIFKKIWNIIHILFEKSYVVPAMSFQDAEKKAAGFLKKNQEPYAFRIYQLYIEKNVPILVISYVGELKGEHYICNTRIKSASLEKLFNFDYDKIDDYVVKFFDNPKRKLMSLSTFINSYPPKYKAKYKDRIVQHLPKEVTTTVQKIFKENIKNINESNLELLLNKFIQLLCTHYDTVKKAGTCNQVELTNLVKEVVTDIQLLIDGKKYVPSYVISDAINRWQNDTKLVSNYISERRKATLMQQKGIFSQPFENESAKNNDNEVYNPKTIHSSL